MTVEQQLTNAILSSGSGVPIYNLRMPTQNPVFPLIVYQRVTSPVSYNIDGSYCHSDIQFQFTCWGKTLEDAQRLGQQVYSSLSMYQSDPIWRVYIDNRIDRREADTGLYYVMVLVTCRAKEF
jgi:hypothetical protein